MLEKPRQGDNGIPHDDHRRSKQSMVQCERRPGKCAASHRLNQPNLGNVGNKPAALHKRKDWIELKRHGCRQRCSIPGKAPRDYFPSMLILRKEMRASDQEKSRHEDCGGRIPANSFLKHRCKTGMADWISGDSTVCKQGQ